MNLSFWCFTILVLQTMMSEITTEKFYDRSNEKIIMEGLEIIGTYFKEFNKTLADYVSDPSKKHELKGSCRNATVKTSFQEISRKSNLKVIIRNTTEQLSLCFSEVLDQPVPEEVNEICLHRQSIKKSLKNSKAGKFFGENGGGDSISCSIKVKRDVIPTQSTNINTVITSTQSAYEFNVSTKAINSTVMNVGWFAGGVALGFLTSTLILLLVWLYKSYQQRGKEIYKKKNDKKKMSTVYEDIDEYEMIPIYRDCEAHCRLTSPKKVVHKAQTLNKEQLGETSPDHYFGIEEDKTTVHISNCHSESDARMSSSSCEDQSSATQITFIEQTDTYFVLENNKDRADNHDAHDYTRDSIENQNNSSTGATTTNIRGSQNKYAKDCSYSDGLLNATSNKMDKRNNNVRDDPDITDAKIAIGKFNDNPLEDDVMNDANNADSGHIESSCTDDDVYTETNSVCNEYNTLILSEIVSQDKDDTSAIYM